jgi:hypothetical protein
MNQTSRLAVGWKWKWKFFGYLRTKVLCTLSCRAEVDVGQGSPTLCARCFGILF